MDIDLGTVLITLALVFTGSLLSLNPQFSIGGADARVADLLLDGILFGPPRGLDGSHNFIETDGSLTRDDLYVTGNAWDMNMTKFLEVYRWGGVDSPLRFDDVGDIAAARWQEAVATNPYFWYGPLTGYLPRTGGFALTARTMSNYSEGSLEGVISKSKILSLISHLLDSGSDLMKQPRTCSSPSSPWSTTRPPLLAWRTREATRECPTTGSGARSPGGWWI